MTKRFGAVTAVERVGFRAEKGKFVVLLGPSGCGKSTLLRLIAGLEEVSEGRILIEGRNVTRLDPTKRRISMVFQSYALFPHLTVAENIVFGLKVRRTSPKERQERLSWVAELVGLAERLHHKPQQLSGGQRQRVALVRAIVSQDPICLMAAGTPAELYSRPATTFAARFIGTPAMNLVPLHNIQPGAAAGLTAGIRPEHIRISGNGVSATVVTAEYHGADTIVTAQVNGSSLLVRAPGQVDLAPGSQVRLGWEPAAVHIFDSEGRKQ